MRSQDLIPNDIVGRNRQGNIKKKSNKKQLQPTTFF